MTFPNQSSEKSALVPVLAMLLQFSPKEIQDIQKASRDPNFNARIVKEVKRIDFTSKERTTQQSMKPSTKPSNITSNNNSTNTFQSVKLNMSDQDLHEKLNALSDDILDYKTHSQDDQVQDSRTNSVVSPADQQQQQQHTTTFLNQLQSNNSNGKTT
jgi:hypothetical protein